MLLKQYYVESRIEFFKEPVEDTLKKYKTIKQWAYILHDKDSGASPHYHIYLNFGNSSVDSKVVAEWFGLQESQVEKVKGRKTDALLYLTHGNDSQKNKHQYSPEEVHANFDFGSEIKAAQVLGDFEHFSYAKQLAFVNSLPVGEKSRYFNSLEKLWKLHCLCMSMKNDRKIEVVFIYGKGGSGKTYYAKKLFENLGYDYCVSSSENDPFQDYLGQDAILLDDLRDEAFPFPDLLKILDNHTSSSVKSRFSNRVFNGKMIVITSSVPIRFWYKSCKFDIKYEDLYQLYRRIGSYVEIKQNEILVYNDGLNNEGYPIGEPCIYKNEVAELKKQSMEKSFKLSSCFDNFAQKPLHIKIGQVSLSEYLDDDLPF